MRKAKEVINELFYVFDSLEIGDTEVINKIYRRDEICRGSFINQALDLVLLGEAGFNLKANIRAKSLWEKDIFSGKYIQSDAFLLVNGNFEQDIIHEEPSVHDIVEMMDRLRED